MENTYDVAVVYHSAFGHNKRVAQVIHDAAAATGVTTAIMSVDEMNDANWEILDRSRLIVFGCPTYLGSVTYQFKKFMDDSGMRWVERTWQGKWAAGFTVSGGLSGDKLSVLQQLCLYAVQQGMNWAGLPKPSTGKSDTDFNRLSSFMGLMCQANDEPAEVTPPQGDIDTAKWFGEHLASISKR